MKKLKKLPQFILGDGSPQTPRLALNFADKRTPIFFYSALGISLGIIAGILLGITTLPAPRTVDVADSPAQPAATARPTTTPGALETEKPVSQPASVVPIVAAGPAKLSQGESHESPSPAVKNTASGDNAPAAKLTVVSTPHRKSGGVLRVAVSNISRRPLHRVPAMASLKSEPGADPSADSSLALQPAADEPVTRPAKTMEVSSFYVEGDLMVVDFNASAGKLETSDGRSFLLDSSGFDNASNWSDDRTDVHYRCAEGGVCVLKGPGAAPMSARLI